MPCTKHSLFKLLYTVSLISFVPFYLWRFVEIIANTAGTEAVNVLQLIALMCTEFSDTVLFIAGLIFICSVKTPTLSASTSFTGGNQTPNASRKAASPNEKLLKNTIFVKGASVFCSLVAIAIGLYRSVDVYVTYFAVNIILISISALFAFLICKDDWLTVCTYSVTCNLDMTLIHCSSSSSLGAQPAGGDFDQMPYLSLVASRVLFSRERFIMSHESEQCEKRSL